jgi:hypothetical protein
MRTGTLWTQHHLDPVQPCPVLPPTRSSLHSSKVLSTGLILTQGPQGIPQPQSHTAEVLNMGWGPSGSLSTGPGPGQLTGSLWPSPCRHALQGKIQKLSGWLLPPMVTHPVTVTYTDPAPGSPADPGSASNPASLALASHPPKQREPSRKESRRPSPQHLCPDPVCV